MLQRTLCILLVAFSLNACFKKDVFEYERSENFLETDFYNNDFQSFNVVVKEVNFFDPIPNGIQDTSYMFSVTYGMEESFYNDIREEWAQDIILARVINTSLELEEKHYLEAGRLIFTDTVARRYLPSEYTLKVNLVLRSPRGVMASLHREQTIELKR